MPFEWVVLLLSPLQWEPLETKSKHDSPSGCDPVVIPIGVVGLALGAGDQQPSNPNHGQRNTQENPVPGCLLTAGMGAHLHTVVVTCCMTESARLRNAAVLAE